MRQRIFPPGDPTPTDSDEKQPPPTVAPTASNPTESVTPRDTDSDRADGSSNPIEEKIVEALRKVYDPEIPVNIYDLGLIYKIHLTPVPEAEGRRTAQVLMTLTTPHCPEAQSIPGYVKSAVETVDEITEAGVEIVWDPPWSKDMMSDEAKLQLGMF